MVIYKWIKLNQSKGFVLPVTMIALFAIAMFCLMSLDRLKLNQDGLQEERVLTASFLAFQAAKSEICQMLDTGIKTADSGSLTESSQIVNYTIQSLSPNQYQVNLKQKTPLSSTLSALFVYNKETQKIEKWVGQ